MMVVCGGMCGVCVGGGGGGGGGGGVDNLLCTRYTT